MVNKRSKNEDREKSTNKLIDKLFTREKTVKENVINTYILLSLVLFFWAKMALLPQIMSYFHKYSIFYNSVKWKWQI